MTDTELIRAVQAGDQAALEGKLRKGVTTSRPARQPSLSPDGTYTGSCVSAWWEDIKANKRVFQLTREGR